MNILDSILWTRQIWEKVTPETIQKFFTWCGYDDEQAKHLIDPPPSHSDEDTDQLMDVTQWGYYVSHVSNTDNTVSLSDMWKEDILLKPRVRHDEDDDEAVNDADDEQLSLPPPPLTI